MSSTSHEPGQMFAVGSTNVVYQFEDESSNQATCDFTVQVEYGIVVFYSPSKGCFANHNMH